jgi:hypothetical protein
MAEQEYYVRKPDSENARGPFNLEKLQSLAEAGQVDRQSLYYDQVSEKWKPIGESSELCARLFPERIKLVLRKKNAPVEPEPAKETPASEAKKPSKTISLKKREETAPKEEPKAQGAAAPAKPDAPLFNPPPREPQPAGQPAPAKAPKPVAPPENQRSGLSVNDLLAAAEGQTEEMAELRDERKWRDRAIATAMPLMALLMLISSVSLLIPWRGEIVKAITGGGEWLKLLEHPRLILGALDLFLALMLGLAVASIYPILRLRLMAGLGYLGYMAYAEFAAGRAVGLFEIFALAVFSTGVFLCSITTRFAVMLISGLAALTAIIALGAIWNMPGVLS